MTGGEIIETKIKGGVLYFNPNNHSFYTQSGKDKNRIPSVTSITGVIDKSAVLIGWAVRLAKDYLIEKLGRGEQIIEVDVIEAGKQHTIKKQEAADIGTRIHELAEQWIKTTKSGVTSEDSEAVINGFNAFLEYQEANDVKWLGSEMIVYSAKHNFAGITDGVGHIGTDLVLFDFKSAKAIYPEHILQAAGYQLAYEEMTRRKIAYRLIIRFGKDDGTFEVVKCDNNDQDKAAFLACVTLKNRLKELEKI